jgi:hypothetical protein
MYAELAWIRFLIFLLSHWKGGWGELSGIPCPFLDAEPHSSPGLVGGMFRLWSWASVGLEPTWENHMGPGLETYI